MGGIILQSGAGALQEPFGIQAIVFHPLVFQLHELPFPPQTPQASFTFVDPHGLSHPLGTQQAPKLQLGLCVDGHKQATQPFDGAGFVQLRLGLWVPGQQAAEQADHPDHADHPPFTGAVTQFVLPSALIPFTTRLPPQVANMAVKKSWNFPPILCPEGGTGQDIPDGITGIWGVAMTLGVAGSTQYFHPSEANPLTRVFPGQVQTRLLKYVPNFPGTYCPVGGLDGYDQVVGIYGGFKPELPSQGTQIGV
ncbi:MAG: hypothetical protein PHH16_00310 [Candidatus Gracilibacteria bacterium]|nr:hypothetical protein [Candidatus Gracilibacteria bacterium]